MGSTGSVGTQALQIIEAQTDYFQVEVLTAFENSKLLIEQALRHKPNVVVIGNDNFYQEVFDALDPHDIQVYAGEKAIEQVVEMDTIDMVLMAIVGFNALKPLLRALEYKKPIALANKESLVVAGQIISEKALQYGTQIIPVDSEHSAIFQTLMGELNNPIHKIVLTASGGPFLNYSSDKLKNVSVEQALNHPNWKMGDKVSIDSATMMNKGFEAIAAKWLFDLKHEQIEVVIHPQSIVHSFVYFADASVKAQLSIPDMHIPIQFALTYPNRLKNNLEQLDLLKTRRLEFAEIDTKKFTNLALAFEAMKTGGNTPCVLNASNEFAVKAFLSGRIGFVEINKVVEQSLNSMSVIQNPSLDELFQTDFETRKKAEEIINKLSN